MTTLIIQVDETMLADFSDLPEPHYDETMLTDFQDYLEPHDEGGVVSDIPDFPASFIDESNINQLPIPAPFVPNPTDESK